MSASSSSTSSTSSTSSITINTKVTWDKALWMAFLKVSSRIQNILRRNNIQYKCRTEEERRIEDVEDTHGYPLRDAKGEYVTKSYSVKILVIKATLPGDDYEMVIKVVEPQEIITTVISKKKKGGNQPPLHWRDSGREVHFRVPGFNFYLETVLKETKYLLKKEYDRLLGALEYKYKTKMRKPCGEYSTYCGGDDVTPRWECFCTEEECQKYKEKLESPFNKELARVLKRLKSQDGEKIAIDAEATVHEMEARIKDKYSRIVFSNQYEEDAQKVSGYYQYEEFDYDYPKP